MLDMAIAIEDEATIYYEQLADWTGNDKPEVADFFKRMAVREKRHHDQIVAQRERLFPDATKSHAAKVSWAVEAPDYDAVPNDATLKQAFDAAMDAETFGIIIEARPGQRRWLLAQSLADMLHDAGKRPVLMVLRNISPERLVAIGLDAYVNTAPGLRRGIAGRGRHG